MHKPALEKKQLYALGLTLGAVLLVSVLAVLFGHGWRFWRHGTEEMIAAGRPVTVMLNALDDERALDGCAVFVYEPADGRVALLGIPANTRLTLADSSTLLLRDLRADGVEAQREALAAFCGFPLPFYLEMTSTDFRRLVDLLRGLEVRLDRQLTATVRGEQIVLPIERYRFNSDKIRQYLAYTAAAEPAARPDLMQRLLQGFAQQLRQQQDFLAMPEVWGLVNDWCRSNLTSEETRQMLLRVAACSGDALYWQDLPGSSEIRDGNAVFVPRALEMATLLPPVTSAPAPAEPLPPGVAPPETDGEAAALPATRLKIALLNGTGQSGVAHGVRQKLADFSELDIVEVGNADRSDYRQTRVIARQGGLVSAQRVRQLLGIGQAVAEAPPAALVDVTIIIGKDYLERRNTE